ncbi:SusC/RagA family TonB-linked outer membrane protein [Ancylomarina longa]|uniref:TonB-dependent receptor n=1 Tax=Ancylomarina longa TaxID=2487017 RepID=A0A434AYW6_9BACT|nr:TonB-dependent receptor [Ancylomarina longa]RUT79694.1 TonB-dependent receptor [Ancylomarina longa]
MKKNAKTAVWQESMQYGFVSSMMKLCILVVLFLPFTANAALSTNLSNTQQALKSVSGTVVDQAQMPLIGVNIIIKGTSTGTVTDFDGKFELNVPDNALLQFSFIGYLNQEIAVGNQTNFNIILKEDIQGLNEVIVVGYGVQKKSDLTGAVSSVKSDEIAKVAATNPTEALQGKIAGVSITKIGGAPGAGLDVKIRGIGTVGNHQPLYIIDGIPGDINFISSTDIASIEVLKDGAAAAIYGSRAANGVVLVTTKKGKKGKTSVEFSSYLSINKPVKTYNLLNADEYVQVHRQMYENAGSALPTYITNPGTNDTDWIDQVIDKSSSQNYSLRVSGAGEHGHFSISGNFTDDEGIVLGSDYNRNSLRAKMGTTKGRLTVNASLAYTETKDNPYQISLRETYHISPLVPVLDENEKYGYGLTRNNLPNNDNPVAMDHFNTQEKTTHYTVANVNLDFKLAEGLIWTTRLGLSNSDFKEYSYHPDYIANPTVIVKYPVVAEYNSNYREQIMEHMLAFQKDFGKHSLNGVAAFSLNHNTNEWNNAQVEGKTIERSVDENGNIVEKVVPVGFDDPDFKTINAGKGGTYTAGGSNYTYNRLSVLGRINYAFDNKYLFQFTMRRDGSSKFGSEERYGNFPSASFGWRLTEEAFMKRFDFLDNLKLRASWGLLGNEDTLNNYEYQSLIYNSNTYAGGYSKGNGENAWTGSAAWDLANRSLRWEETESINIGLDYSFLNSKIFGSINYYKNTTSDMLITKSVAPSAGVNNPTINVGEIVNKGLELELTYSNREKEFKYDITGTFTTMKNEVVSLSDKDQVLYGQGLKYGSSHYPNQTRVGHEIGAFYLYQTDGIFQSDEEVAAYAKDGNAIQSDAKAGDIRYKDVNDDGKINEDDKVYSGSGVPDFEYSVNFTASYKNFDFTMFWQGVSGNKIYNGNRFEMEGMEAGRNFTRNTLNAWTPTNTNTNMPRAVLGDPNGNTDESTRFLENGSYLKLRNIQLGYNLPKSLCEKLKMNKLRLYVSGQNLFTITDYSGIDPEVAGMINSSGQVDALSQGVDRTIYPMTKSYVFGLQVTF